MNQINYTFTVYVGLAVEETPNSTAFFGVCHVVFCNDLEKS